MSARTVTAHDSTESIEPEATTLDSEVGASDAEEDVSDVQNEPQAEVGPIHAAAPPSDDSTAAQPGTLAQISAQLREAAAEVAEIAAQAGRLGIAIDAAKALREGTTPEVLRSLVLQRAAAAADARDIVAAPPSPVLPQSAQSPIVAAAKRAASAGTKG